MSSLVVWTVQSPCQTVTACWVDSDCSRVVVQRQRNSCRSVEYWSSGPRDGADVGVCKTKMTVSSVVGGDSSARYGGVWPRSNLNTRIVPSHSPLNPPMSNVLQSYLSLTALPSQPFFPLLSMSLYSPFHVLSLGNSDSNPVPRRIWAFRYRWKLVQGQHICHRLSFRDFYTHVSASSSARL